MKKSGEKNIISVPVPELTEEDRDVSFQQEVYNGTIRSGDNISPSPKDCRDLNIKPS